MELFGRGFAWLDTGTHESMLDAANFIHTIEKRQGVQVACLEEIAFNNHWLSAKEVRQNIQNMLKTEYAQYLMQITEGKY